MKRIKKGLNKLLSRQYSVRTQLFGITAFFICIGTFAILLANSQLIPLIYTLHQKNTLVTLSNRIESIIYTSNDFYSDMAVIEENNNIDIEIYSADHRLIYNTAINSFMQDWVEGYGIDLQDVMRSKKLNLLEHTDNSDGSYFEKLQDTGNKLQYLMYAKTIGNGDATVKVYAQQDYLNASANATTRYVSLVACATFMFIIISMYLYLHHFSKPIIEMNKITRDMAKMDFSQKCPPYNNSEIGELGQSINTLSESLDKTLKDLKEKNEKLQADIEHERRIEQMKKEFVSNSSHELKTPIAIIQGYAEGLKLGMKNKTLNTEEYCDIIIEETHKMNRLVCEMLELSKYESDSYELIPENFEISAFIEESIDSYDILAKEKGIEIINTIPYGFYGNGDQSKLEMVIHNYVSNALSHAKYDKKIILSAQELEDSIKISVFNTGDHIAAHDLENIWQSFYRADKAHSRSEGRFGLGLSIVKAIQDLHGMPYSVENVDSGVTFSFEIKKAEKDNSNEI